MESCWRWIRRYVKKKKKRIQTLWYCRLRWSINFQWFSGKEGDLYLFLGLICFQKRSYKSQLLLWFHHNHLCLKNIYGKIFQSPLHQPCCSLDNPSPAGSCSCSVPDRTKAGCLADQTEMPAWTGCCMQPLACCLNATGSSSTPTESHSSLG